MDKPISIKVKEFKETIVTTVNNSGLPVWYIADFLESLSTQVRKISDEQLQNDMNAYNNNLTDGENV